MTLEHSARAASDTVKALSGNPMVLALILINIMFMAGGLWFLHEVVASIREDRDNRNAIVHTLLQTCGFMKQTTSLSLVAPIGATPKEEDK